LAVLDPGSNPFIYSNTAAFNDVTKGSNKIGRGGTPLPAGFNCSKGWDPVTGVRTTQPTNHPPSLTTYDVLKNGDATGWQSGLRESSGGSHGWQLKLKSLRMMMVYTQRMSSSARIRLPPPPCSSSGGVKPHSAKSAACDMAAVV